MSAEEFLREFKEEIASHESSFLSNIQYLKLQDRSFCDWVEVFIAWMEFNPADCNEFYVSEFYK